MNARRTARGGASRPLRAPRRCIPLMLALAALLAAAGCGGLSGEYEQVDGPGKLEFKGDRVYITTTLGMTFVTTYELDGDRVIIKGAGGSQVYSRTGDTLEAGMGIRYVRRRGPAPDPRRVPIVEEASAAPRENTP